MSPAPKKSLFRNVLRKTRERIQTFQEKFDQFKKKRITETVHEEPLPPKPHDAQKMLMEIEPFSVVKSAALVLLLVLFFYFLSQISGILVLFFVAFLLAAALQPIIDFLQAHRVPRSVGVLLIYLVIFVAAGLFLSSLVPLIATQVIDIAKSVGDLIQNLTTNGVSDIPFSEQLKPYIDQLYQAVDLRAAAAQVQSALQLVASQLLNVSFGLMNVLLVLILTFFMTVEEKSIEQFSLSLFPSRYGRYISTRLEAIKAKIGYWLRGQLLLSLVATMLSYVGLLILGVKYALTLSVISGITMLIPVIGRVFAWALTMPIVLNQSPLLALWVSIYYFILQQIENNVLSPYIMNKAVGLSPIIIIFAMLVGSQYLGILGLVISIPIATTVAIFVNDYIGREK